MTESSINAGGAGLGGKAWEVFDERRGSFWGEDNFWRERRQRLHSIINVLNVTELYTHKWLKW